MAVVWGTVRDHHGYIDVSSTRGRGTTFTLYFPQKRASSSVSRPKIDLDRFKGNGQFVLVVDDIDEQRQIAVQILQKLGYRADSATDGDEVVRYVAANNVDLLILDMIMTPGMDGLDTCKQISALRPGIKAIIASGFSETDRVRQARDLGVGGYVRKPYTLETMAQAVWKALSAVA
jgi:two-component system cell cycle sensor histidine kinase/response regulator CckA